MKRDSSVLLTDLYQLSMLYVYWRLGMEQTAVFEFFVKLLNVNLPAGWLQPILGAAGI